MAFSITLLNGNRLVISKLELNHYISIYENDQFVGTAVSTATLGLPSFGALKGAGSEWVLFRNMRCDLLADMVSSTSYSDLRAEYFPGNPYVSPAQYSTTVLSGNTPINVKVVPLSKNDEEVMDSGILSKAELNALFGDPPPLPKETHGYITVDEFLKGPDRHYIYDGRTLSDMPYNRALMYLYDCYRKTWKCDDVDKHIHLRECNAKHRHK